MNNYDNSSVFKSEAIIICGAFLLIIFAAIGAWYIFSPTDCVHNGTYAVVLDKIYVPRSGGSGSGMGISSDGKPVIMTYDDSSPEKFRLVYKYPNGKVSSDDVSLETYYTYEIGSKLPILNCTSRIGITTSLIRP